MSARFVLLSVLSCSVGCSWPADRPLDLQSPTLSVGTAAPAEGAAGVPTDVVIEVGFDGWPEAPVVGGAVRMTAGPQDVPVHVAVDLVGKRLRVTPARYREQPPRLLDPDTGYTVAVAPALRAIGGATLKQLFVLKFRTGLGPAGGSSARPAPGFALVWRDVVAEAACAGCHGAGSPLDLSSEGAAYTALRKSSVPGDSARSLLLRLLVGTPDAGGTPHAPLSDAQLALVRDWLDSGATP